MQDSGRRYSHNVRTGHVRLFWIFAFLLALVTGSLTIWADSKTESREPAAVSDAASIDTAVYFISNAPVILFEPGTGRWVLTTFGQIKPKSEFWHYNHLFRVIDSERAQSCPNIDAAKLFEADRPYDAASRRPAAGDVVQVYGKDMQPAGHAFLKSVQPGTTIRFQGKAYKVAPKGKLEETGAVFSPAANTLQRIEITQSALQHIFDRHTAGGRQNAGKSIFNAGVNIQVLIKDTQLLVPIQQTRGNCQRVFDAGRMVGYDRTTSSFTSIYTVITTQSGKLVTAFPGQP